MLPRSEVGESVWAQHESVIRRFEDSWGNGRPDLAAYVASSVREPGILLVELIQIDLEFRFRAGEQPRVEEYLQQFPELDTEAIVVELLGSELTHRDRHGPPYTVDELRARFPQLSPRFDTLLLSGSNRGQTRTRGGGNLGRWVTEKPVLIGYTITGQLGRGGMGMVYRAEQKSPSRTVAVKTLLAVPNERMAARFRREAEAMARLDHPNIVPVYEVGEWTTGGVRLPFLTMKWYAGGSLDTTPSGPGTSPEDHARVVELIARALHHAHQRGVLHRDLKPSNILMDGDGRPAVGDFGLAGWFDPESPELLSESIVGTPAFMAPEQATDPSGVTTATDVYGLGAILYHLLTGRPPIQASTAAATLGQLGLRTPDRPSILNPAVSRDLETICLKCLETDPRNRYPSAVEVAEDLSRWRNGESITARRPGVWEQMWRGVRRHPVVTVLSAATFIAILVTIVTLSVSLTRIREKESETSAALARERRTLYLEQVAAASRLYHSNHTEQAWYTLSECPPEHRAWEWHYLDRVRELSGGQLLRHDDIVLSVAILSDGRTVTATRKKDVFLWAGYDRTSVGVRGDLVRAHPMRPLIAVQGEKFCRVIDLDRQWVVLEVSANGWVDFSPDGNRLLVADGPVLRSYETTNWQQAGEFQGHEKLIGSGVFSSDGETLFLGSGDKTSALCEVVVWDWARQEVKGRWKRTEPVTHLSISSDGKTLFEVQSVSVSATDSTTGTTRRLIDVQGGRYQFLPTAEAGLFLTNNSAGELLLRTIEASQPRRVYRGHTGVIRSVCVSRDGKRAVTGGEDGTARVWDLTCSPEYTDLASTPEHTAPVLSADGERVGLVERDPHAIVDGRLSVRDTHTGRELYRIKGTGDAHFDPSERWLAVGRVGGSVVLCDPFNGKELRQLHAGSMAPLQVRFSPDGSKLASADPSGIVRWWDTNNWNVIEFRVPENRRVRAFAWSPDGSRIALAAGDEVLLWDPISGEIGARLRPIGMPITCAFSPDGKTLAVTGRGRSLELFELDSYRTVSFVGNPSLVNGLAFNPTGTRLASVGVNGFARVWDTATGKEVLTLNGGSDLFGVSWSPDGHHLYASGTTLRRWSTRESSPNPESAP